MARYDPEIHHRQSVRLSAYDYGQAGAYFVTICTQDRRCWFGTLVDDTVMLSQAGQIVRSVWECLPTRFPSIELDAFVIMPNHVHGIIIVGARFIAPSTSDETNADSDRGGNTPES